MQFRLLTVLYVFALLAAGMAVFGGWGIALGLLVLTFLYGCSWRRVRNAKKLSVATPEILIAAALSVALGLCLAAMVTQFDHRFQRSWQKLGFCNDKLSNVSAAIQREIRYHEGLPPAAIYDEVSQARVSWRKTIGPAKLIYECTADGYSSQGYGSETDYFAVLGSEAAWNLEKVSDVKEFADNPSQTILVLEAANMNVLWTAPIDLTLQEAFDILTGRAPNAVVHKYYSRPRFFYETNLLKQPGVHAAFADGSVRFLPVPLDEKLARALLTANGGEVIPPGTLDALTEPRLNYARIYGLCVFVMLALLPGLVLWRRRSKTSLPEAVVRS